jgi:hypothetical protein
MHSRDDHRASNPDIPSGGHDKVGVQPGADQSGAHARLERIAKEQELIMPDEIRLDDRRRAKAKHRRPGGRPPFESIALLLTYVRPLGEAPRRVKQRRSFATKV